MKVLVAFEFSGVVREAFRQRGHEAWSCDLLEALDESKYHLKQDVFPLLERGDEWDLIIAHPPCTYICNGSSSNITRRPWLKIAEKREQEGIPMFMKVVESPCNKLCIENPIGVMSTKYRKPDQVIHPYMFGEPYRKDTCLWLKNLPKLEPTNIVDPPYKKKDFWSNKRNPNGYSLKSITYKGIADAMAEQWGT